MNVPYCEREGVFFRELGEIYSIEPEAVHSEVQPVDEDVVHLPADLLVAVVEVGLLRDELVEVELLPLLVELPGSEAEQRELEKANGIE